MKKVCLIIFSIGLILFYSSVDIFAGQWEQGTAKYSTGKEYVVWLWQEDENTYAVSQWKEIDGKQYYFDENGYMQKEKWIGKYYVGENGEMLTNTVTPDRYFVGADGKYVPEHSDLPVTPYYACQSDETVFLDGAWDWNVADYGMLYASKSDFIDCGSYYEVKNQELKAVKQYDSEFEGENAYASHRLPNGKYAWHKGNGKYESVSIYTGSLYMMKDAEMINCDDSADKRIETVFSLEEYLEKWEELPGGEQGILWGYISEENDKGYITKVQIK